MKTPKRQRVRKEVAKDEPFPPWMRKVAAEAESRFAAEGIELTLGGEPTFVPFAPSGSEWSVSAVGPTKLGYARAVAEKLLAGRLRGGVAIFCPGKLYPGEVNPRWAIRLIARRDGRPLLDSARKEAIPKGPREFAASLARALGIKASWISFRDPLNPGSTVLATPLDHKGGAWHTAQWSIPPRLRELLKAEGPAGLRLPLDHFPEGLPKRVLTIEWRGRFPTVFFPPLLCEPFLELLVLVGGRMKPQFLPEALTGYLPPDMDENWTVLGLAADPGVLEINLPVCPTWEEYARWVRDVTAACDEAGLRPWKEPAGGFPEGTGGGNHILWGGPTPERNPFFTRPRWLAGIIRTFQHHPSLSYLFTGCYVGPSSQAPRPDESARSLEDLEMAYRFLEDLPPGDHREIINETLRHLHTDVAGNTHRAEMSFDKFWNPGWPGGANGLVEFRAFESLPNATWSAAAALLLHAVAAAALDIKKPGKLVDFGARLHDRFFLPTPLWVDFQDLCAELAGAGLPLDPGPFRAIWDWRFPVLLDWQRGGCRIEIRKAMEGWPLLCETPLEGGNTSRFVDSSLQRVELSTNPSFAERYRVFAAGRELPIRRHGALGFLAGLRFRRTRWHPSLHPGIPPHMPLLICLVDRRTSRVAAEFELAPDAPRFVGVKRSGIRNLADFPCRPRRRSDLTFDLRFP